MADLAHFWGSDLTWSPTGDLTVADVPTVTQQRVLRRLLTAPGDYLWSLDYGAGLATFVGLPGAANAIVSAIRGQVFKEAAVAQTPAPAITLNPDQAGNIYVQVTYSDALLGASQTIAFYT